MVSITQLFFFLFEVVVLLRFLIILAYEFLFLLWVSKHCTRLVKPHPKDVGTTSQILVVNIHGGQSGIGCLKTNAEDNQEQNSNCFIFLT